MPTYPSHCAECGAKLTKVMRDLWYDKCTTCYYTPKGN